MGSDVTHCIFPTAGQPGEHRCSRCNRKTPQFKPGPLIARCTARDAARVETFACVHRGPQLRAVAVPACCGEEESLVPVFACAIHGECHRTVVNESKPPSPTLLARAGTAASATLNWATSGFKMLPIVEREARKKVCDAPCEANVNGWCTDCGCVLSVKQALPKEHCPRSTWPGDPPNPERLPPKICAKCPDRKPPEPPRIAWEWISTEQLIRDTKLLLSKLPPGITSVAGVPRSGMIPASALSALLQVPLYQLTEAGTLEQLGHGNRARVLGFYKGAAGGKLLIVDDTVNSGRAMQRATQALRGTPLVTAAVYANPSAARTVDFVGRLLPEPHLLEWNIFNSSSLRGIRRNPAMSGGIALDFDGILCHDKESGGEISGPHLLPRSLPVKLIATGRHERHRAVTEAWMHKHGVRCDRLAMMPNAGPQGDDPAYVDAVIQHKAREYQRSGCSMFIESCPRQAEAIAKASSKPVACPIVGKVWS